MEEEHSIKKDICVGDSEDRKKAGNPIPPRKDIMVEDMSNEDQNIERTTKDSENGRDQGQERTT